MWLLLAIWLLITITVVTTTLWIGFFWTTSAAFVYFSLNYLIRRSHYSGYDTMDIVRGLWIWRWVSPVRVSLVDDRSFVDTNADDRYIFVVIPNATNTTLVWTFGCHGSAWPGANALRLCYVMPELLFHVPLIRELLLWSGAVTSGTWDNSDSKRVDDRVLQMTRLGRNVAYAPNGMEDALFVHDDNKIHARRPGLSLFQLACDRGYHIVPCLCSGEHDRRYIFLTTEIIRRTQRWMLKHIGYPFPLMFFPDLKQQDRLIDVTIGIPVRASKEMTAETLQTNFFRALQQLNNNGVDKELILKD